ncbi:MAG TPA: hypothetical protein VMI54_04985 [Polyangiaceae bacterium]|nr:hypothetical protein [Polyangiaceae bacterium]
MTAELVRDVARILEGPAETAEKALEARLRGVGSVPPVAELLTLGARAREQRASGEELALAVGALLAFHAEPAGAAFL